MRQLIALSTASFVAFGLFSLPAGWLADRWSRRNMMVGVLFRLRAVADRRRVGAVAVVLGVALFALGVFAAIYHPVGTAMVIENARPSAAARWRSTASAAISASRSRPASPRR